MKDEGVPVGELYFSQELYGEDMVELKEGLEECGFRLKIDPLQHHAELMKVEND